MVPRRILLIDDEGPSREALAHMLSLEGHEVQVTSPDGAQALVEEFGPDTVVYDADHAHERMRIVVDQIEAASTDRRLIALGTSPVTGEQRPSGKRVELPRPVNLEELRRTLRES